MNSNGAIVVMILLIVNLLISFSVFLLALSKDKKVRTSYLLLSWFFLFVPVLGIIYLSLGLIITYLRRKKYVDMSEVSFSQDREDSILPPDEKTELNYVPIQDALAVSDTTSLRRLVLDTLRNNAMKNVSYLGVAMNSKDTETSHYAASIIMDTLSECRSNAQNMMAQMQKNPEDVEINILALEYIYEILSSKIMNMIEQRSYIYILDSVGENLFKNNLWYMTELHYLWLTDMLISIGDFNLAHKWVERGKMYRSGRLETYKAMLHLEFEQKNKTAFFNCLKELQDTDIIIDDEVLNLFRIYQC